jgi:hypothetical protein
MSYEIHAIHGKSKKIVVVLVVCGMAVLAMGVVIALLKRGSAGGAGLFGAGDDNVAQWCELRREWAKEADALGADIALESVREGGKGALALLERQRDELCGQYAEKVRDLGVSDPRVIKVEEALVKEGKVRANTAVEIANLLGGLSTEGAQDDPDVAPRLLVLREVRKKLEGRIKQRISGGRKQFDEEVGAALAAIQGCRGIYRGPITALGAADNPYVSWGELELRREKALGRIKGAVRELEPKEEFANQVYHDLVRNYRKIIKKCYSKYKRLRPSIASELRLQIRLQRSGQVRSLALRDAERTDERILDCLLETAAKWRLPRPVRSGEVVVVTLDASAL